MALDRFYRFGWVMIILFVLAEAGCGMIPSAGNAPTNSAPTTSVPLTSAAPSAAPVQIRRAHV